MDVFRGAERLMAMDEAAWERHASPFSVYSRFAALPLLALAFWSRAVLGWWALAPIAAAVLFIAVNLRLFPPPRRTDGWAQRATFGERLFLARARGGLRLAGVGCSVP